MATQLRPFSAPIRGVVSTSSLASAIALLCLTAAVGKAQSAVSYSRFDFSNGYRMEREDAFPNARSRTGNETGDLLYKAFPVEALAQHKELRISGLRIAYSIGNGYKGSYPAKIIRPRIAFYPATKLKYGAEVLDAPDLSNGFPTQLAAKELTVFRDGLYTEELKLTKPIVLPTRNGKGELQGWCAVLLANPGERLGDGKAHFVAAPSYGEIHRVGSPTTYSGAWDARKKRFLPYGSIGAPSNLGELGIGLLLDQPTLQIFSDASGGVRNDPKKVETHMGPGAYINGLATAVQSGYYGLYVQWEGKPAGSTVCIPLLMATGSQEPKTPLQFGNVIMLGDLKRGLLADLFIRAGLVGVLQRYKAGGIAGHAVDQNGVYVTPILPFPHDPTLAGMTFWVQGLMVDLQKLQFTGSTNLTRIVF